MKKHFLLFIFMLPLIALAQQTPSGTESLPVRMDEAIPPPPPPPPPSNRTESTSSDEDKIFVRPEVMPEFPGGTEAMYAYIAKNLQYPADALEAKLQGTVYLTFVVDKDGGISNLLVLRGISPSLDEEAIRVMKRMPKWKPGFLKGEKIRTQVNLPVKFSLK